MSLMGDLFARESKYQEIKDYYLANLTDEQKRLMDEETTKLAKEAEVLADRFNLLRVRMFFDIMG